jgi:branched-chain amino acid transport system permease protein
MRSKYLWLIALFILLILAPLFLSSFLMVFLTEMLIMILFAISFNLLFGYTGLLSFGHAAFFSIGSYVTGLVLLHIYPSIPLAFVIGVVAATIAAWIIGYFCVRLDEIYFAMLTLAFGMMIHTIIWKWDRLTGGADGLVDIPRPNLNFLLLQVDLSSIASYYYFTLILVAIALYVLWVIVNSHFGLALKAIRENSERLQFVGINVRRYRLISFVISGFFCGLAGALFGPFLKSITPSIAFWTKSAEPVFMSLLGGTKIFLGPAVGAVIFMYLKEIISGYTELWMIYLGAILIGFVLFLPGGIVGFLNEKLRGRRLGRIEE